ncbi:AAA domain-containing protein [Infirmifilum sp.]|uniref:AAA domain-containing protein n=1 Tax=Infirmifilum sp. TaxID=2856575 RepID=UPI003D0E3B69
MAYRLTEAIERAKKEAEWYKVSTAQPSSSAAQLVVNTVDNRGVCVVQGPPGTGKTHVLEQAIDTVMRKLDKGELVLYVASTNKLVYDMFYRLTKRLYQKGYRDSDVKRMIRVYGSKFDYSGSEVLGKDIDEHTHIVLATSYQKRVHGDLIKEVHIMVDEASRSRLYEPIIDIVPLLINAVEKGRSINGSLSVVGDPMQAIGLGELYVVKRHKRVEHLLEEKILHSLLELRGLQPSKEPLILTRMAREHLRGQHYEFLDITYRLPEPTERPISEGYYDGELRAKYKASDKLADVDYFGPRHELLKDPYFSLAFSLVEELVTTKRSLLVIETRSRYAVSDLGLRYDPTRAKIGSVVGVSIVASTGLRTYVISPYRDMVQQMKLFTKRFYSHHLGVLRDNLVFDTVHSTLGSEADAVVAILGREDFDPENKTVYFQEPELFNVQLSRHKRMLVLIGDPVKLLREAERADQEMNSTQYRPIRTTIKRLLELVGVEDVDSKGEMSLAKKKETDAGIFFRLNA